MADQPKPPPELDAIASKVLSYKPKPKSKPATPSWMQPMLNEITIRNVR